MFTLEHREDLDKDLEKYLYSGEDGKDRKMNDLDDDLDTYWNESSINKSKSINQTAQSQEENVAIEKKQSIENKEESDKTSETVENGL